MDVAGSLMPDMAPPAGAPGMPPAVPAPPGAPQNTADPAATAEQPSMEDPPTAPPTAAPPTAAAPPAAPPTAAAKIHAECDAYAKGDRKLYEQCQDSAAQQCRAGNTDKCAGRGHTATELAEQCGYPFTGVITAQCPIDIDNGMGDVYDVFLYAMQRDQDPRIRVHPSNNLEVLCPSAFGEGGSGGWKPTSEWTMASAECLCSAMKLGLPCGGRTTSALMFDYKAQACLMLDQNAACSPPLSTCQATNFGARGCKR